ncbi:MAG: hypothetical protein ACYDAJ_06885 [Nitrosotalea sp.]
MKLRGVGEKAGNYVVKCEILRFCADDEKHSGSEVRDYLKENFRIKTRKSIDKHLDWLNTNGFIEQHWDGRGTNAYWYIKKDYLTFKKIIFLLEEYQENLSWNIRDFIVNTKYGSDHVNDDLIDWLLKSGMAKRWYKEWNISQPSKKDLLKSEGYVFGMEREKLLLAMKMSSKVLIHILKIGQTDYLGKKKYHYSLEDQIFETLLRDALNENLSNNRILNFKQAMKILLANGKPVLELDSTYWISTEPVFGSGKRNANS